MSYEFLRSAIYPKIGGAITRPARRKRKVNPMATPTSSSFTVSGMDEKNRPCHPRPVQPVKKAKTNMMVIEGFIFSKKRPKTKAIRRNVKPIIKKAFLLLVPRNLSQIRPQPGLPKMLPTWTNANPIPAILLDVS